MDRIQDPTATADNKFQEAMGGNTATRLRALWLNGMQEELCGFVEGEGLTLDPNDQTQLRQALDRRFPRRRDAVTKVADITELRALTGLVDGQVIYLADDASGGAGNYIIQASATPESLPDTIVLDDGNRAILQPAASNVTSAISQAEAASKAYADTVAIQAEADANGYTDAQLTSFAAGAAGVFADTTAGLAGTVEGDYFNVPSGVSGEIYIVYRHDTGGVATEIGRTPSNSVIAALELEVDGSVASATIGTTAPDATELSPGVFAPVDTQPERGVLDSVSFFLKVAGTYEIHAFKQVTASTWEVVAVWPGSSGSTGLVSLEAGAGVIPEGYVLEVGDFVGISTGTARIAYEAGTEWISVNSDSGFGSIVTRTLNNNGYDISIAYDYTATTDGLTARMDAVETDVSDIPVVRARTDQFTVLVPPSSLVPSGYTDTGVTLLGLRVAISDEISPSVVSEVVASDPGFAVIPALADMHQDSQGLVAATNADDPVRSIVDVTPTPAEISAPDFDASPHLKYDGSTPYLEFDGANNYMQLPLAEISNNAFLFVCSVALRAGGYLPQIMGDSSTSDGLFLGFNAENKPTFSGGGMGSLISPDAVTIGERVTLSFLYTGSVRRIYINGEGVISTPTTTDITLGANPLLCYSGVNVVDSPIDLYGAVYIGAVTTDADRIALEAVLGAGGYPSHPEVIQREIDAAKLVMMQEFGEYFGLLSPEGTTVYALGDSTIAEYQGGTAVMGLITSSRTEVDLSDPGDTISNQKTLWLAQTVVEEDVGWVVMQIGLNDLDPAEAASAAIARLQDLADTIKADIGDRVLLIGQMIPCRQRMINIHGPVDGETAYQKWLDMNEAIAGAGATPITGVDGRITAHVPLMNDGSGNLKAEYDTGDGIHPNTAGRQVIADAWQAAINAAGMTV